MEKATATDRPANLAKFHLGVSKDGTNCVLLFIDEREHAISCVADYAELNAFIASLTQAAAEMSRRRNDATDSDDDDEGTERSSAINVASAAFRMSTRDGCMLGSLIGDDGEIVGIRMRPDVVHEMTRAMLLTTPPASTC